MLLVVLLLWPAAAPAQRSWKLSAPLPDGAEVMGGGQISPDGRHVAYRANRDDPDVYEVFSVPIAGGTSVKLHPPVPSGYGDGMFTPDGEEFLSFADSDGDGARKLYAAPAAGGTWRLLVDPPPGGSWYGCRVSPDSRRIVYCGPFGPGGRKELFSMPIDGSAATVVLSGPMGSSGSIYSSRFEITPDGQRVIYQATQETDLTPTLFSVPIDGSDPAFRLHTFLGGDEWVAGWAVAPDSGRVVYRARLGDHDPYELYSVPVAGGTPWKISGPLVDGGRVQSMLVTPDSGTVVYRADEEVAGKYELYSAHIDGGTVEKVGGPFESGGGVGYEYEATPDGRFIVYRGRRRAGQPWALWAASPGGGVGRLLSDPCSPADVWPFAITPDSQWVVYGVGGHGGSGTNGLYAAWLDGGAILPLCVPPGGEDGQVVREDFRITADGRHVVFGVGSQYGEGAYDDDIILDALYAVPVTGGEAMLLNDPLPAGAFIYEFELSPDGSTVVFLSDVGPAGAMELYAARVPEPATLLLLAAGGLVGVLRRRARGT